VQLPTESTLQYLTRLTTLIANCNYENNDRELLDMVVQNTQSHDIRKEFLREVDTLTLARAKDIARALENSEVQSRMIEGKIPEENGIARMTTGKDSMRRCYRCNSTKHLANEASCPAKDQACLRRHKIGCFKSTCLSAVKSTATTKSGDIDRGATKYSSDVRAAHGATSGHADIHVRNKGKQSHNKNKKGRLIRLLEDGQERVVRVVDVDEEEEEAQG
jgi:hypothetical protein